MTGKSNFSGSIVPDDGASNIKRAVADSSQAYRSYHKTISAAVIGDTESGRRSETAAVLVNICRGCKGVIPYNERYTRIISLKIDTFVKM